MSIEGGQLKYQNKKNKIFNFTIRNKMQEEQLILDTIQRMELKLYGHLIRMNDICWANKIYQCTCTVVRKEKCRSNYERDNGRTLREEKTRQKK